MAQPISLIPDQEVIDEAVQQKSRKKFIEDQKEEQLQRIVPNQVVDQFAYLKEYEFAWNEEEKMGFNPEMERAVEDKFNYDKGISGDMTDSLFERGSITSDKMGTLSADKVENAVSYAAGVTVTTESTVTIGNGNWGGLLVSIADENNPERVLFGVIEISGYMDSVAAANHVPRGSAAIGSTHKQVSYHDLAYNNILARPGKDLGWIHLIKNETGSSHSYVFQYRWRYLGNLVE